MVGRSGLRIDVVRVDQVVTVLRGDAAQKGVGQKLADPGDVDQKVVVLRLVVRKAEDRKVAERVLTDRWVALKVDRPHSARSRFSVCSIRMATTRSVAMNWQRLR